jgi:quinol-cytochrome oxidoreductase complex cytochrome b subunit
VSASITFPPLHNHIHEKILSSSKTSYDIIILYGLVFFVVLGQQPPTVSSSGLQPRIASETNKATLIIAPIWPFYWKINNFWAKTCQVAQVLHLLFAKTLLIFRVPWTDDTDELLANSHRVSLYTLAGVRLGCLEHFLFTVYCTNTPFPTILRVLTEIHVAKSISSRLRPRAVIRR